MDNVIYRQFKGEMVKVGEPKAPGFTDPETGEKHGPEDRHNFLIVCDYGDWSGFRTLEKCLDQLTMDFLKTRYDGFFAIVERL